MAFQQHIFASAGGVGFYLFDSRSASLLDGRCTTTSLMIPYCLAGIYVCGLASLQFRVEQPMEPFYGDGGGQRSQHSPDLRSGITQAGMPREVLDTGHYTILQRLNARSGEQVSLVGADDAVMEVAWRQFQ